MELDSNGLPRARSEILDQLRVLVAFLDSSGILIDPLPRIRMVVDTNVILQDVTHLAKHDLASDFRTALEENVASGLVILYGPHQLGIEVDEKLSGFAKLRRVPRELAEAAWARLRTQIVSVDVDAFDDVPSEMRTTDPDDRPFIKTFELVGARALLSFDTAYEGPGLPRVQPHVLRQLIRDYARTRAPEVQAQLAVLGLAGVTTAALVGAVQLVRALPWWLTVGAGLLVLAAFTNPGVRQSGGRALEGFGEVLATLGRMHNAANLVKQQARELWNAVDRVLPPPQKVPFERIYFSIFARENKPLSFEEIASLASREGAGMCAGHVRSTLERGPFQALDDGLWTLAPRALVTATSEMGSESMKGRRSPTTTRRRGRRSGRWKASRKRGA